MLFTENIQHLIYLQDQNVDAVARVVRDLIHCTCEKVEYCLDVYRAFNDDHIET